MTTAQDMARLHAAAFVSDRSWSEAEFAALLDSPHVRAFSHPHGFALTRTLAGESELLTLAVDPAHQRRGIARGLLSAWLTDLPQDTESAFLEVAADNPGAIALYETLGFALIARREGYYKRAETAAADALILTRRLTFG